jgi:hypothetical protein
MQMKSEVNFGGRFRIIFLRSMQFTLLFGSFLMRPQASEPLASWSAFLPILFSEIVLCRVVYARLTPKGIEYRRWRRWILIEWEDLEEVKKQSFTGLLALKIGRRPLWTRYVLLGRARPSLEIASANNEGAAQLVGLISTS